MRCRWHRDSTKPLGFRWLSRTRKTLRAPGVSLLGPGPLCPPGVTRGVPQTPYEDLGVAWYPLESLAVSVSPQEPVCPPKPCKILGVTTPLGPLTPTPTHVLYPPPPGSARPSGSCTSLEFH